MPRDRVPPGRRVRTKSDDRRYGTRARNDNRRRDNNRTVFAERKGDPTGLQALPKCFSNINLYFRVVTAAWKIIGFKTVRVTCRHTCWLVPGTLWVCPPAIGDVESDRKLLLSLYSIRLRT